MGTGLHSLHGTRIYVGSSAHPPSQEVDKQAQVTATLLLVLPSLALASLGESHFSVHVSGRLLGPPSVMSAPWPRAFSTAPLYASTHSATHSWFNRTIKEPATEPTNHLISQLTDQSTK